MRLARLALALFLGVLVSACGGEPPAEKPTAAADATAQAPAAAVALPRDEAGPAVDDADGDPSSTGFNEPDGQGTEGLASLDDIRGLPLGDAVADAAGAAGAAGTDDDGSPGNGNQDQARMAEVMAAMQAMTDAGDDPEKREAAIERLKASQRAISDAKLQADSDRRAAALQDLPEQWQQVRRSERDGPEADLVVQLGDIDNLGFGWPKDFDPFTGKSTPVHRFPYLPEADDPPGTDRIMVVSGYVVASARRDGYTYETERPGNAPQSLEFEFDVSGIDVQVVALQLFVDDFQSKRMGSRFRAWLDDREVTDLPVTLNALDQTGPIGKLLTLQLLPEYLDLLDDGRLEVRIDDPDSDAGDGYAFDFARLLVNPKGYKYSGTVRGITVDTEAGKPLAGVLVSASNVRQALSDEKGMFVLEQVPAGLVVTTGSKPDYSPDSEAQDLIAGQTIDLVLELTPLKKDSESLAEQLERERKVDLYGIYFDTAKATLKPESEETLQQVLGVLQADLPLRLVIAGHTDSEGGEDYNQDLSERRAASVVAWLVERGVDAGRLASEGLGETSPVADNGNAAGRALNRRVEVRLAD